MRNFLASHGTAVVRTSLPLLLVLGAAACPSGTPVTAPESQSNPVITVAPAEPVLAFPLTIELPAELAASEREAERQSVYLDGICKDLGISSELSAKRPEGTGCPRPGENESVGAN